MIFASTELAARLERAEVTLLADCVHAAGARHADSDVLVVPVAGGVASYAGPGSPLNKLAGAGFGDTPDEATLAAQLDEIERAFHERACPVQAEVATLADPAVAATLTRRGYVLMGYENVLGLDLARFEPAPSPDAIAIEADADLDAWIDLIVTGFATPDTQGVASHEDFPRESVERTMRDMAASGGFVRFSANLGGLPAGGASMRLHEGVAQLAGAATLPAQRRRGVQSALLHHRLGEAARAGCDLAVVTTLPGSKSQQNIQRLGFELLYTRAHLVLGG